MDPVTTIRDTFAVLLDTLGGFQSIAVATIALDGSLRQANSGFAHLVGSTAEDISGRCISDHFTNPGFPALAAASLRGNPLLFEGILTLTGADGMTRSVHGLVYHQGGDLLLVAEQNVREMETLTTTLLEINHELIDLQRKYVKANQELQRKEAEITKLMLTDILTGLPNRRHFEQEIEHAVMRSARLGFPLCLAICDIDRFKTVNDNHGHNVGDIVLRQVATCIKASTREIDFCARWGGEEFVILFTNTPPDKLPEVTERVRAAVDAATFDYLDQKVTISVGSAYIRPGTDHREALRRADDALLDAKKLGRNMVVANIA